jgi:hypothetical protein
VARRGKSGADAPPIFAYAALRRDKSSSLLAKGEGAGAGKLLIEEANLIGGGVVCKNVKQPPPRELSGLQRARLQYLAYAV